MINRLGQRACQFRLCIRLGGSEDREAQGKCFDDLRWPTSEMGQVQCRAEHMKLEQKAVLNNWVGRERRHGPSAEDLRL